MMNLDRRFFLAGLTGLAMTGPSAVAASRKPFFQRIGKPIGLQLYTLGEEPTKDLSGTFARLGQIGYKDLQLPSLLGKTPAELKAAADRIGARYSCIHLAAMPGMSADSLGLMSSVQKIVDDLGALGIKDAVMPILQIPDTFRTASGKSFQEKIVNALQMAGGDTYKKTANLLNERAAALKPHGIQLGYHNHNLEFAPLGNTTGWDILVKETDPALIKFEVDVGWVAAAGLDPVAFMKAHKGRVRWLHVKDLKPSTKANYALTMDPTEVGSGKQDWAKLLPAARKAGIEHFYVEQEAPFSMPRLDSAAKGFEYLSKLVA